MAYFSGVRGRSHHRLAKQQPTANSSDQRHVSGKPHQRQIFVPRYGIPEWSGPKISFVLVHRSFDFQIGSSLKERGNRPQPGGLTDRCAAGPYASCQMQRRCALLDRPAVRGPESHREQRFHGCRVPSFGGLENCGFRGLSHFACFTAPPSCPPRLVPVQLAAPAPSVESVPFTEASAATPVRKRRGMIEIALADANVESVLP